MRHVDVNRVWAHEVAAANRIHCENVVGSRDVADPMTNDLKGIAAYRYVGTIGAVAQGV